MIIADTSIWIEFFRKSDRVIDDQMTTFIESNQIVALSVVFGELLQGVKDAREERVVLDFWKNLPKVDESDLFIEAGKLSFRYKLFNAGVGLIDAYILAASRLYDLEILSLDKKLIKAYQLISA